MKKVEKYFIALCLIILSILTTEAKPRIIVWFHAHHGDNDCESSKGICVSGHLFKVPANFNEMKLEQGYALLELDIIDEKLQIVVIKDHSDYTESHTIEVVGDIALPADVCESLGYSEIIMLDGYYKLDRSRNESGEVLVLVKIQ